MRSLARVVFALALSASSVLSSALSSLESSLPSRTIQIPRTNAERFAAGMPPLPPTRRSRRSGARRQQQASPLPCVPTTGVLVVRDASTGLTTYGYVSEAPGSGHFTAAGDPVYITLCIVPGSTAIQESIDIPAMTTHSDVWPYMGAMASAPYVDLQPSTSRYVFIQATSQTPPGSPPAEVPNSFDTNGVLAESAIWNFNPVTYSVTSTWTNPDGTSLVHTPIVYMEGSNALVLAGDASAVTGQFGGLEVTFTFLAVSL